MGEPVRLVAGDLEALVDPIAGASLIALRVGDRDLLRPRPDRGAVMGGQGSFPLWGSFLMAPWVGPMAEGRLRHAGRVYTLPRNEAGHAVHGLVASGPWEVETATARRAALNRPLSEPWPFGGSVRQTFELDPTGIILTAEIRAAGRAMPAAIGWHPWFRRPDDGDLAVEVAGDAVLEHLDGLPTGRIVPPTLDEDLRAGPLLADRRIDVVYVGARSPAIIRGGGGTLEISFDPAMETLVVYTPPEAVCVEPWSSWPDASRMVEEGHAAGLAMLEPGQVLRRWTRWAWRADGA
jgi:aldose 1-epimerase